jgi:hypothetical protein
MERTEWLMISSYKPPTVRIFGILAQREIHWSKDGNGIRKLKCSGPGCPKCAENDRRQTRWVLGVIDRADGNPKLMEVGAQLMSHFKEFVNGGQTKLARPQGIGELKQFVVAKKPMWFTEIIRRSRPRDLKNYDVTISKGEGPFGAYDVGYHVRKPLTRRELETVVDFLSDIAGRALEDK